MAGLLEERELRLDGDGVLGDRVDDARAEALERPREAGRAVAHAAEHLVGKQLGPRVEPDAQHAPPLCRQPLETLPEAARHAVRLPRGSARPGSALAAVRPTATSSSAVAWRPGGSATRSGTRRRAPSTRLSASASGAVHAIGTTPGARPANACASRSASAERSAGSHGPSARGASAAAGSSARSSACARTPSSSPGSPARGRRRLATSAPRTTAKATTWRGSRSAASRTPVRRLARRIVATCASAARSASISVVVRRASSKRCCAMRRGHALAQRRVEHGLLARPARRPAHAPSARRRARRRRRGRAPGSARPRRAGSGRRRPARAAGTCAGRRRRAAPRRPRSRAGATGTGPAYTAPSSRTTSRTPSAGACSASPRRR